LSIFTSGVYGSQKQNDMTLETLLKERGQLIKKGTLSRDGALEFWEDGTQIKRSAPEIDEKKTA